jgi:hypothetical protein
MLGLARTLLQAEREGRRCRYHDQYMERIAYVRSMITTEVWANVPVGSALEKCLDLYAELETDWDIAA